MQQRIENETKRFKQIISEKIPVGHEVSANRRDGIISVDWVPIAKVVAPVQDQPANILVADASRAQLRDWQINMEDTIRIFRSDESRRRQNRAREVVFSQV